MSKSDISGFTQLHKDAIGKKFNNLTVLEFLGVKKENNRSVPYIKVKCECGIETTKKAFAVYKSQIKKCGQCGTNEKEYSTPVKVGMQVPLDYVMSLQSDDWEKYFLFGNTIEDKKEEVDFYNKYVAKKYKKTDTAGYRKQSIGTVYKFCSHKKTRSVNY